MSKKKNGIQMMRNSSMKKMIINPENHINQIRRIPLNPKRMEEMKMKKSMKI